VKNEDLELDESFCDLIFRKLKSFLLEIIWGKELEQFFPKCFKKVSGASLESITIPSGKEITKFMPEMNGFDLLDKLQVSLSNRHSFLQLFCKRRKLSRCSTATQPK
jgi:hypothetical protein